MGDKLKDTEIPITYFLGEQTTILPCEADSLYWYYGIYDFNYTDDNIRATVSVIYNQDESHSYVYHPILNIHIHIDESLGFSNHGDHAFAYVIVK